MEEVRKIEIKDGDIKELVHFMNGDLDGFVDKQLYQVVLQHVKEVGVSVISLIID